MKVLVVDDDARLREALELGIQLQWQDAQVVTACDGQQGLERFFEEEPDVVLLDITMPRMNGLEVLERIRRVSDVPVIMLSARGEDIDQVRGLEMGADDYVAKPFSHAALMARITAALRRAELPPPIQAVPDIQAGELAIHFQNQEVTLAGEPVKLTPVEYKLLYHLVRNAGHLVPHRALLERVWGIDQDASPEYLKVFVSRVRSKLRTPGGPEYIETERGRGYRFVRPEAVSVRSSATPNESGSDQTTGRPVESVSVSRTHI
ncbi:MAG TPA: response regulator transcription factor [Chloroflexota bacterium]|jgi:two-component system KDP operon response regulator KdpE